MTVKQIVRKYLKENDYDGLCNTEILCGCETDDLCPCGEIHMSCQAGYKNQYTEEDKCGCDGQGTKHWHIDPEMSDEELSRHLDALSENPNSLPQKIKKFLLEKEDTVEKNKLDERCHIDGQWMYRTLYGLGFAFSQKNQIVSDDMSMCQRMIQFKIYLGPWMYVGHIWGKAKPSSYDQNKTGA